MVKMGQADREYRRVIEEILENGIADDPENVRPKFKDGTPATTIAVMNPQMKYDNSGNEALLLTTKKVAQKDPVIEGFWIWQQMSNVVQDLRDAGCTVWNEWELEDGTIGTSYGWQLANKKQLVIVDELFLDMYFNGEFSFRNNKVEDFGELTTLVNQGTEQTIRELLLGKEFELNQVDHLLYMLKKDPTNRGIKTTLWCVVDLRHMGLRPCVYETQWEKKGGKVHVTVGVRSNDMALTLVPSVRNGCRKTSLKRETLTA